MKLSTLLLLIGFLQVSAKSFSQVTLSEKHSPLEKVLSKIEKQTGYNFIYDEDKLKVPFINVSVHNVSIEKALDACFTGLPATYSIIGNTVILKPASPSVLEKIRSFLSFSIPVKGIITDTAGNPLRGATVFFVKKAKGQPTRNAKPLVATSPIVVGGSEGMLVPSEAKAPATSGDLTYMTDNTGSFNFDAEVGDELGISYIGYKTVIIKVTEKMPFQNIVLHSNTMQLVEVRVQTGYQTLSKERATGSFSKPDMNVFGNRSSSLDVISRLEGQIPGLVLTPIGLTNGYDFDPTTGAKTQRAVIRGENTIRLNSQPLYVVNGVIVPDFSVVNVDDIADVTVLRDAAAAAIWGARAANGVIVVTTKGGAKNQGLKIAYNGFINFEGKPDFDYARKRYLSSSQYIDVAKQLFDPVNYDYGSINSQYNFYGPIAPSLQVLYNQQQGLISAATASAQLDSMARIDNSSQVKDLFYRNAYTTNHTLSASGGTRTYSVYGSLGYANSQSSAIGTGNSAYKINLSQSFTPNDRFSFSLSTQLANNTSSSKSGLSLGADVLPYQLFNDANGNPINIPYLSGWTPDVIKDLSAQSGIDLGTYQPFDELDYKRRKSNTYAVNVVGNASVRLWKGLKYLGTYGYSVSPTSMISTQDNKAFSYRKQLLDNAFAGSPPTYLIPVDGQYYESANNNQRRWTVRNQLAYNYSGRGGNDLLSLQGGQEANELFSTGSTRSIYGYDPQLQTYPLLDYYTLNQGVFGTIGGFGGFVNQPFREDETTTRYSSYFALASYTLNNKYSIDASWRTDHSNLFGSDVSAQNKPAYSAGLKWNVKNEPFMAGVKWLDALALRGTYGVMGNSPYAGGATVYDVLSAEQTNYLYSLIGGPAYRLSGARNSKLSWEATHTTNIGVDFAVLQSRLYGSVEYYHKKTIDLLGDSPVNFFTGSTSSTANIGKLVNNGINITLNSTNVTSRNFTWQSSLILGRNTNKIVEYEIPTSSQNAPSYLISGAYVVGYSRNSLFAYKYAGLNNLGYPQVYLKDGSFTSDPNKPTRDDLIYMGTTIPKVNGGFSNNFRYKQFRLAVNMYYSLGGKMRRDMNPTYNGFISTSNNLGGNLNVEFLERWQKPGDEKTTDIPGYLSVENSSARNTQFYTAADINVVSSSYLKLNEASLSYDLSPGVLRLLKVGSASVRLQLNNVLLWKANKFGINPEFQDPNAFYGGARIMPINQHTITLGANINF
ncbi:SusC/RagA family TonB-linked outer membrane protein [Mucilaginibacter galii]|nr:SusC/RagA family TonB-linked outer membrane protein [Mucilaginibacter galii]